MAAVRLVLVFALATALAAAGCGGGGEDEGPKTFDDEDFAITFQYPGSFEEFEDVSVASTAGAASTETRALGLNGQNVILVDRYDLRIEVTKENLADVKPEVDQVVSQAAGQELSGTETEVGGLPGFEYVFDLKDPPNARTRFLVLFHGATEYALNCQSTPHQRDEVDAACQLVMDTLEPK
jgi:hypothetical protein